MTASPPRRQPFQFSLRLLLLALTAFAIAFPLWYRWPYEEVVAMPSGVTTIPPAPPVEAKRITTWQRQWGGGRLKHGLEREVLDGLTLSVTTYRNGQKHGPYAYYTLSTTPSGPRLFVNERGNEPTITGQYVDGTQDVVWTDKSNSIKRTSTWRRGKLEGPYEIENPGGRKFHLLFADGRLTHFNGRPARNRLFDLHLAGELDQQTANELIKNTSIEFVEVPLRDGITYLHELHNIPMTLDVAHISNPDIPITADYKDIDLCSALTLLTAPHDLACDYRYGMIWITTAKDAEDWHDSTGVAALEPPKGTALARAWNEPASLEAVNQPLASILAFIAQPLAIEIDTSQIVPTVDNPNAFAITGNAKGLPFRHSLGYALYQAGCRCKLDGDKLVILPPEDH